MIRTYMSTLNRIVKKKTKGVGQVIPVSKETMDRLEKLFSVRIRNRVKEIIITGKEDGGGREGKGKSIIS